VPGQSVPPLMNRKISARQIGIGAAVLAGVAAALLILLAAFPWGVLRGTVEREAAERFGRPVIIGSVERTDTFGFHPSIAIRGVRVPQPGWAGPGELATLREARVRFSAWALLTGDFVIEDLSADGLRLGLVRAADGRTNWERPGKPEQGGSGPDLAGLTLNDTRLTYRDAKQDRQADVALLADPVTGLRADGRAVIRGMPARLRLRAAPLHHGAPWPFEARLAGDRLAMVARGRTERPLDTDAMTLDVRARAADLKLIDAVIEAGLIHTQPVVLTAHVRHERDRWAVTNLSGTVGRSRLTGRITVAKQDGRTKLDGALNASVLDFEDLSSDEGLAKAAALERAIGPRLVPNTRVNLRKIDRTDGRITFRIAHIASRRPSSLRSASGTLMLDHQLLTVSPLRIGFSRGTIEGRAVVDQRGGAAVPKVTLDLTLRGSDVAALAGGSGDVSARIDARALLVGRGSTIREAVGRSGGRIGLVARDGQLPARIAAAMGFDAVRTLTADKGARAALRCAVVKLDVAGGRARTGTMVIDTSQSRLDGTGTLAFPGETLDFRLEGAPKRSSLLRVPGNAYARGTLRSPELVVPPEIRSAGNIFKAIGRAVTGRQGPVAVDANCRALSAAALR